MAERFPRVKNIPLQLNTLDQVALHIMCAAISCENPDMSVLHLRQVHRAYERAHEFLHQALREDELRAKEQ